MTGRSSWPFWKPSKQQGTPGSTAADPAKGGVPTTGIGQTLNGEGTSHAVGQGTQNIYNITVSDEVIAKILADLVRVLSGLDDAPALINEVASNRDLNPDRDLGGVLGELADGLIRPDQLPLPLQVSEIARQCALDPKDREALEEIGDHWAAEVPGGQPVLTSFRNSIKPDSISSGAPCLLVILDPDRTGGHGYRLSMILFQNGHEGAPVPSNDDALRSLDEIKNRLHEVLPPVLKGVNRLRLLVEFVVPPELLNMDFDRWSIPEREDGRHSELGIRYPVVVRDLLRLDPDDDHALWRKRWQHLSGCTGKAPTAVRWIGHDSHTYESLSSYLMNHDMHREVCLVMLSAPSADTTAADLLSAGLTAGIPAAIWLRQHDGSKNGSKNDKKYLARVVESAGLSDLPGKVLVMRQTAAAQQQAPTHPGRHLSLLWDDPNRMWSPGLFRVPPPASPNGAD